MKFAYISQATCLHISIVNILHEFHLYFIAYPVSRLSTSYEFQISHLFALSWMEELNILK